MSKKNQEKLDDKNDFEKMYSKYHSTHEFGRYGKSAIGDKTVKIFNARYASYLPDDLNARIIDVGCGSGRMLSWLQGKGYLNLEGIEGSIEQIKLANDNTAAKIVHSNIKDWNFQLENYDLILVIDVLEHLTKIEGISMLNKLKDALKPGGTLLIQVPNFLSPFGVRIQTSDITHETVFNAHSLAQMLRIVGFTSLKIFPWTLPIVDFRSLMKRIALEVIHKIFSWIYLIEAGQRELITSNIIAVVKKNESCN